MNYQQQVEHYKAVRLRIANASKKLPEIEETAVLQCVLDIPKDPRKEILKSVAQEFGVKVEDLLGSSRVTIVKQARWKAAWLLHQRGTMSISAIAKFLNKNHTTILHALNKYKPEDREK